MTAIARKLLDRLRESYWFVPAAMVVASIVLACAMVWIDGRVGSGWMDGLSWLYAARPDGARSLLSAIGGSMVTVAGTVFSVTIAAVVYASGQYGPRLLSNFMEDRGNQATLGTFIATFLYCMIVLRTIRSPEETGGETFVPQLALVVAVVLMIASVAMLVFFIHHVPTRIHISNIVERIGTRLIAGIDQRFPRSVGQALDTDEEPALPPALLEDAPDSGRTIVPAGETGYVQLVDEQGLMAAAAAHGLTLSIRQRPGAFVHAGDALAWLSGGDQREEVVRAVRQPFSIGARRSPTQDLSFLIHELAEIAARALSPGVNDPFTAMTCIDWLGAAFADLAGRIMPSRWRADDAGRLRVVADPVTFSELVEEGFGRLATYAASDANAAMRYLATLRRVVRACKDEERRGTLVAIAQRLVSLAAKSLDGEPLLMVEHEGARLSADAAGR